MARTLIIPSSISENGTVTVANGTISGSSQSALTRRTSDSLAFTGGATPSGVVSINIELPSAIVIDCIAIISHTMSRNSWFNVRVGYTQSEASSSSKVATTFGHSFVHSWAGHSHVYVDVFDLTTSWTAFNGASLTVTNRVATLTQQVAGTRESVFFSSGDIPADSTLLIDAVQMSGIEAGIGFGNRTTGSFDRIIRHNGTVWEYLESPFSTVLKSSDAPWSPMIEIQTSEDGLSFDLLAEGNAVFRGLPLTSKGFGLWTAQSTIGATAKWRLFRVISGHLRPSVRRENGIALLTTPTEGRWIHLKFDNNIGGVFSPFEIGRIIVGGSIVLPDADRSPGFRVDRTFQNTASRTAGENILYPDRPSWRSVDLRVTWTNENDFLKAQNLLSTIGRDRHALLVYDPDTIDGLHERMAYGAIKSIRSQSTQVLRDNLFRGTTNFSLEEEP